MLLFAIQTRSQTAARPRVAIIGSGISGASTAYFLARARRDAELVIFERDRAVGGRTRTRAWRGARTAPPIDEGATSVSTLNVYLVEWMREFNISRATDARGEIGIWDGRSFRFRADAGSPLFAARVLWRYGASPLRLRGALRTTVAKLRAVYELQAAGASFDSPEQLFRALGLFESTQANAATELARAGVGARFVSELVDGASRCNYLQPSAELSAFVNLVSLAGAALEGSVFRVHGGTAALTRRVLNASRARVRTGVEVLAIERRAGSERFTLATRPADRARGAAVELERFDAVVIAAPLEASAIELRVAGAPPVQRERPFVRTHVTFVEADGLSGAWFGASAAAAVGEVLTVTNESLPFHSIGLSARLARAAPEMSAQDAAARRGVWKLFSKAPLADAQLDGLFAARGTTRRVVWDAPGAYPVLRPTPLWPPFKLAPGLAYAGAMESAVSCMETQAIAGRNAALLVAAGLALDRPLRKRSSC